MTQSDRWRKRPAVLRYYTFCDHLKLLAKNLKYEQGETLEVIFHVPMPKSWSKKKKEKMRLKPHTQRPDLDNYVKAFLDGLLDEDSHVHTIKATKIWDNKGRIIIL